MSLNGRLEREEQKFNKIEALLIGYPKIMTDYYYHLRAQNKTGETVRKYIDAVGHLLDFLGTYEEDFYERITSDDICKFLISKSYKIVNGKKESMSTSQQNVIWYGLTSFFDFLEYRGLIDKNPVRKEFKQKLSDNPTVTFLTEKEVEEVVYWLQYRSHPKLANRNRCIFMLGVTTGLRASAILQINLEDVDLENRTIRVIEKRNQSYNVHLGSKVYDMLLDWLDDRQRYFGDADTDALFLALSNNRMSYHSLREMLIEISKFCFGDAKKITPHVMRHTCATLLYNKTGDIYLTSKQLHHSDVSTTQRYAELAEDKIKDATNMLDDMLF